jgi:hypothetical protein
MFSCPFKQKKASSENLNLGLSMPSQTYLTIPVTEITGYMATNSCARHLKGL